MLDAISLIVDFFNRILALLVQTTVDGVSIGGIIIACIVIGMISSIFWKGAKS